ncbi:MAG: dTMP kinase [Acetivibrionales bacterium]
MKRGLFISVEGIDGSGKSTQMENMKQYLSLLGCKVILTREPGGTRIGESIRSILLDPSNDEMCAKTELLLYSASRSQLVEQVIKPSLEKSITVICDRYVDSFYAYQGYGRGISLKLLDEITGIATGGIMPDITIFLDLDPFDGQERRASLPGSDRIENEVLEFHLKVYNGYKELAKKYPSRIKTINAAKPADMVWKDIRRHLDMVLGFARLV